MIHRGRMAWRKPDSGAVQCKAHPHPRKFPRHGYDTGTTTTPCTVQCDLDTLTLPFRIILHPEPIHTTRTNFSRCDSLSLANVTRAYANEALASSRASRSSDTPPVPVLVTTNLSERSDYWRVLMPVEYSIHPSKRRPEGVKRPYRSIQGAIVS